MRVVPARFAMKVDRRIPWVFGWRGLIVVLAAKALEAGPRLEQRPIDGEMLVGEEVGSARLRQDGMQERRGDVALQQPITILAERRRRPDRIVHPEVNEPAKQYAVVDLLHQQPLAADRVEILEQQRTEELLRRNRRAPDVGIHLR